MSAALNDLVRNWLAKAHHDLISARLLAFADTPVLDTAIYHCQQAAEKAVKGFLAFRGIRFDKTHDVRALVAQAEEVEPTFSGLADDARLLTPYAVEYRYPGDAMIPDPAEFDEAYQAAERVCMFVFSLLPPSIRPS